MTVFRARAVRRRMWWTTLLVLIALGGAGLAVAADRPHNSAQRPELTWRADRNAQPWMIVLADRLELFDAGLVELSEAGRKVLGSVQALDIDAMNTAITNGDAAAAQAQSGMQALLALRDQAAGAIDESRLGPPSLAVFDQLNAATDSAQQAPAHWHGLAASANEVAGLVDTLLRHDGIVFRATTAGRQAQWDDALAFLAEATALLDDATATRDRLAQAGNVATLDDLLARYGSYDSALISLYAYVRDTGNQSGPDFDALNRDVEDAQDALPSDTSVMSVIVSEAAGRALTDGLIALEHVHGDLLTAVAAVDELSGS